MSNWKVIPTIVFATVLIFGAGVFTGGFMVGNVQKAHNKIARKTGANTPENRLLLGTNQPAATNESSRLRAPEILSKRFLQQLDAELTLKSGQRDAIQKIIEDGQNLMRKNIQDARLEIRDVLTPDQRIQFDELMKRPFHKPIFGTNAPVAVTPTTPPASAKSP